MRLIHLIHPFALLFFLSPCLLLRLPSSDSAIAPDDSHVVVTLTPNVGPTSGWTRVAISLRGSGDAANISVEEIDVVTMAGQSADMILTATKDQLVIKTPAVAEALIARVSLHSRLRNQTFFSFFRYATPLLESACIRYASIEGDLMLRDMVVLTGYELGIGSQRSVHVLDILDVGHVCTDIRVVSSSTVTCLLHSHLIRLERLVLTAGYLSIDDWESQVIPITDCPSGHHESGHTTLKPPLLPSLPPEISDTTTLATIESTSTPEATSVHPNNTESEPRQQEDSSVDRVSVAGAAVAAAIVVILSAWRSEFASGDAV